MGLLCCLDMLFRAGAQTALADFMSRELFRPGWPEPEESGRGHFPKIHLPRPGVLRDVPRQYSRYGALRDDAVQALKGLDPPPDLIMVTSLMTYWYPGVIAAIRLLKSLFPRTPVCLGGIYASLCFTHASGCGADLVISGPLEAEHNWEALWSLMDRKAPALPERTGFSFDTSFYPDPDFSVIMTSRGCCFSCPYCASSVLYPAFCHSDPDLVINHIQQEYFRGVRDFAFYDDALLVRPEKVLIPVLEYIISNDLQVRLHAPNALHVRFLEPEICGMLKKAGLVTVRLGLETGDFSRREDKKLDSTQWRRGVASLLEAGFSREDIRVYILAGLPGAPENGILKGVELCRESGLRAELNYYSPIPGTPMFRQAELTSGYPLNEPLCHNISIWPCVPGGFSWDEHKRWKRICMDKSAKTAARHDGPGK